MTPQDQAGQMPPGLMDALMSGGGAPPGAPPDATGAPPGGEPSQITVTPPDSGGGQGPQDTGGPADSAAQHLQDAIDSAQAALQGEPDSAISAKLAKIVQELYAVQADAQDSHISAMGGNPKDMRAMHRASGYQG